MSTIHYPAKHYSSLKRDQLVQLAYALEDQRDRALRRLEAIEGKPAPDWADVRAAARKHGWRIARDNSTVQMCWTVRRPDEDGWFIDDGWGTVTFDPNAERGRWLLELVGPGPYRKSTASVVDPSPAEVLTAARLVGLDGSES